MKARPILFSAPMVRALLDGRKTQTRRTVKPQPQLSPHHEPVRAEPRGNRRWVFMTHTDRPSYSFATGDVRCPYGQPGDLLWVRETWAPRTLGHLPEMDRYAKPRYRATEDLRPEWGNAWKPSIHMPRWASRLTLRLTDVRVERLQDISEEDAQAEGVEPLDSQAAEDRESCDFDRSLCGRCGGLRLYMDGSSGAARFDVDCGACDTHAKRYRWLWEAINGPDSWAANPWVWALTFDVIKANVDQVLREAA